MSISNFLFLLFFLPLISMAQNPDMVAGNIFIDRIPTLNSKAAKELLNITTKKAESLGKKVTIVILDASGELILASRGENVGPHNTEAARRKGFTALSTKTATLKLMRTAQSNPDSQNLNTLPELLLLSGGSPIFWEGSVVGSIGVAGGGSAENDDMIASAAQIPQMGITTKNTNN